MLTAAFSSAKVVTTAAPRTQAIWRALTSSMLTYFVQRHTTAQIADCGHETKGRRGSPASAVAIALALRRVNQRLFSTQ